MIVIVFKNDQNMLEMSFDIAYIGDAGRYTTMIITLTLNPSIDYTLTVDEPLLDVEINRTTSEQMKVGGKGLNVSMMLDKLQIPSRAIALLGGFTGDYIEQALQSYPRIDLTRVPVDGMNRINVKLYHGPGTLCVNARGPEAGSSVRQTLSDLLEEAGPDDWVLVCGNMMRGLDEDFLTGLCTKVHQRQARLVIDMEALSPQLIERCRPDLIKPNFYEFKLLTGQSDLTLENLPQAAAKLRESGVDNILVSLGADGALLAASEGIYRLMQEPVEAVNQVGSGDAMLAAFVGKLTEGCAKAEALAWAGAAGSSVAMTHDEVSADQIAEGLHRMHVHKL